MKKIKLFFAVFVSLQLLVGCAAMGVPSTDDPARKLGWAQDLVEKQDRPIPAERLIRESIDIYQEQKNEMGLAQAYRIYGLFFKAPSLSLNQWQSFYQEHGFLDKSATYQTRFPKALEYFEKSLSLSEKNKDVYMPANLYLQIALTHQLMRQNEAACPNFNKSLEAYKVMMAQDSQTKISLPKDYATFEKAIADLKNRAGCKQ